MRSARVHDLYHRAWAGMDPSAPLEAYSALEELAMLANAGITEPAPYMPSDDPAWPDLPGG